MIRVIHPDDAPAIIRLWREFYPEKYWLDERLIATHCFDSPVFDFGASLVSVNEQGLDGFIMLKRSATPSLYPGGDEFQEHVQAIGFVTPVIGSELLAQAEAIVRARGVTRLVFGQDSRHFFPGVPAECTNLTSFLEVCGFEPDGTTQDVEGDLSNYTAPAVAADCDPDGVFRVATASDLSLVEEFFTREFPLRWKYDVLEKMRIDGSDSVLILEFDGKCHGFALLHDSRATLPIGGAVWRHDLGENWGSLGPIGVSKDMRGRAFGHALLSAGLLELKRRGVRRCIIDWTNLLAYYGRHGFTVNREYQILRKTL